ncbi:MAG: ImmA/IrrE family metallo-endopeptidase [Clostridiaceae bacterium]|nr:ImmA/IrrE family metallo-endopeptidase [Clostridiaceae bacterium]
MRREMIEEEASALIAACGTRNPFSVARQTGATIRYKELGSLKGMYLCLNGERYIVINPSLPPSVRRIVCAHELGHDRCHRELALNHALHEFAVWSGGDRTEYEANLFAAALLIDDDDLLSNAELGPEQLVQLLGVDTNLIAIKLSSMHARGYDCPLLSYRSDFLMK